MHLSLQQIRRALIAVFVVLIAIPGAGIAFDENEDTATMSDVAVELNIEPLKDFLAYSGCRLNPLERVKIGLRRRKSSGAAYQPYEELWYHKGQPVGCRRFSALAVDSGERVLLKVRADLSTPPLERAGAAANAVVRILTDLAVKSSGATGVIIPLDIFDLVVRELERFGFFKLDARPDMGIRSTVNIYLLSEPQGQKAHVYLGTRDY